MRHFVITRFNIPTNWKVKDEWETNLIWVFKTYAIMSIMKQTNLDFDWIIYFKPNGLPKQLKWLKDVKGIHIKEVMTYADFLGRYKQDVKKLCKKTDDIITTRFDADDMLGMEYVSTIRELAKKSTELPVVFNPVKTYKIDRGLTKVWIDYRFSGHFVSVLQTYKNMVGCYDLKDTEWNKFYIPIQITKDDLVCEIIGDTNVINRLKGFPYLKTKDLSGFGIPIKIKTKIFHLENFKIWKFSWRKWLIYKVKLKRK